MMAPPRIEKVCASSFRGATTNTTIDFDSSKAFVLLFGENGTGKSTVVDAIDFVCNQSPGSISNISGATLAKHLRSIGSENADVAVELTIDGKAWKGTLNGARISVEPDSSIPKVAVLRRNKILQLVLAKPADRFAQLKQFIDVEGVQKSEDELKKALNEVRNSLTSRAQDIATAEETLRQAHEQDRASDEGHLSYEEWAKQRAKTKIADSEKRLTLMKAVTEADVEAGIFLETKNDQQMDLNSKRNKKEEVEREISRFQGTNPDAGVVMVDLLKKAQDYIGAAGEIDACPVCKKGNDAFTLQATIRNTLDQMTELTELAQRKNVVDGDVKAAEENVSQTYIALVGRTQSLAAAIECLPEDLLKGQELSRQTFPNLFAFEKKLTRENIDETNSFLAKAASLIATISSEQEALGKKVAQHNMVESSYTRLIEARKDAETQQKVANALEEMHDIVHEHRIRFVEEVLDAVADECDRLYQEIHPGEGIGQVRFTLEQERRGSMHMLAPFAGEADVPPQAYFSESHLDTLGFCFFLALTKHTTQGDTIVVLDDVFISVDLSHIERILDLLMTEAEQYHQIILTTHQRRWLTFFESNRAPKEKADIISLRPWSLAHGIHADRAVTTLDSLRDLLVSGPIKRRELGSTAGFLIETVLEEMTKHLGCGIQRNPADKYTGASLLDSIKKKSSKIIAVQTSSENSKGEELSEPPLAGIVENLRKQLTDGRNTVGDHFNWEAADVSDKDVQDFAQGALLLAERFICSQCGGMAVRLRDGHLWCSCKMLRVSRPE